MPLENCSAHGKPKSYHCFVCHKPLCGDCPSRDGCCSERCQQSRLNFGARPTRAMRKGQGPIPLLVNLVKLAVVLGLLYWGAKQLGVMDYLPPSLGGPQPSPSPTASEDE